MGIDKSNIRTVIHNDLSPSFEAYLQELGCAERDRTQAELYSPSDRTSFRRRTILQHMLDSALCFASLKTAAHVGVNR